MLRRSEEPESPQYSQSYPALEAVPGFVCGPRGGGARLFRIKIMVSYNLFCSSTVGSGLGHSDRQCSLGPQEKHVGTLYWD